MGIADRRLNETSPSIDGAAAARRGVGIHALARTLALASLCAATIATRTEAAPGDIDLTFGGFGDGGTATVNHDVPFHAVAPDGKVVLAGYTGVALKLIRLKQNGSLDPTFGSGGVAIITALAFPVRPRAVAVQSDGRIVVAGHTNESPSNAMVARVTASGAADPTFSGDGFTSFSFSTDSDVLEKVLIQPDGKIVVAGRTFASGDWDFAAARLNTDGSFDTGFSGDGKATVGFGGDDKCWDAALQADGKLVMVGESVDGVFADGDFTLARLGANGALDGSFDGDGKVVTGFGDTDAAFAVAIQANGRIVAGGRTHVSRYYSSDGSLDDTFDGDGKLTVGMNVYDIAITQSQKILLMGQSGTSASIFQRTSTGAPDPAMLGDGVLNLTTGGVGSSLSLAPDGRMLAVIPGGGTCVVKRLWPDPNYDMGGRQAAAFDDATFPPGSQELGHAMAIQSDGKIVVAGEVATSSYSEKDVALARFGPDGLIDASFGTNGRAWLDFSNDDVAKAMVIQPDGRIVVAGYAGTGSGVNFLVARFNSNGTLDGSFGFGGYNVLDFQGGIDYGHAVALQPDGKIVVAGAVQAGPQYVFGIARFTSSGFVDNTFDGDGKTTVNLPFGTTDWPTAVLVQNGTRIVTGGFSNDDFVLVAHTLTGAMDVTFGANGYSFADLGGNDYLYALAVGADHRLYAAGVRELSGFNTFALAQFESNGVLASCPGCWPGGVALMTWGRTSNSAAFSIDSRGDGQIVAAGTVGNMIGWAQFGSSSTTPTAVGLVDFAGNDEAGLGVRFTGSSGLVVGGYYHFDDDHNFALARFGTTAATVGVGDGLAVTAPPAARLQPALPNPFVRQTTLAFDLPRAQSVRVVVYDATGRAVRTLADESLPAGRHQRIWDGADDAGRPVAAGVYFVRLDAGADRDRRALVMLR